MPILKHILPADSAITELKSYKRFHQQSYVGEDEARDNFFREQQIEEEYKR